MANTKRSKYLYYSGIFAIVFVIVAFSGAAIAQPFRLERYVKPFVIMHLISALGWLFLFTYQSRLALSGQITKHRNNLKVGTILVLITTVFVVFTIDKFGDVRRLIGESVGVLVFASLYFIGIWAAKKGKFDTHKRLMLIATLSLVGPAFGRVGLLFNLPPVVGIILNILTWILVPIFYDVLTRRSIHKATIGGITVIVASFALISVLLS